MGFVFAVAPDHAAVRHALHAAADTIQFHIAAPL
jgi:hypothetical protein